MVFKEFFIESGNALNKLGIEVSRINKQEFLDLRNNLEQVLKTAGLKSVYWTMGSAGSWAPEHAYYSDTSAKKDAGDVDIMLDAEDVMRAFPPDKKVYKQQVSPEKIFSDNITNSKNKLAAFLTSKNIPNTGASLNCAIPVGDKYAQVDLIVKSPASEVIHGHMLDYSQDVGMKGSDIWLKIYPTLVKLLSSPSSGKFTTGKVDPATGEQKSAVQLSPDRGLVDRENNKVIYSWANKDKIAQMLIGPEATARDMSSLSGIKKALQNYPDKWNSVKHFFPAKMQESVNRGSISVLTEGIEHPEDIIISGGVVGAENTLAKLASLATNSKSVSIKWDGFPALIFGWKVVPSAKDPEGQFLFVDKHMYDKMTKGKLDFTTIEEYDKARGSNRLSLWKAADMLVPSLKKAVPQKENQYFWGDLMWTGTPEVDGGYYVFEPNTVKYKVKVDTDTGHSISKSVGGIAVHTFIPQMGAEDKPLTGLQGLKRNAGITFLVGEIKDKPKISIPTEKIDELNKLIKSYKPIINKFLADIEGMKAKSILGAMGPFITTMLNNNDVANNIVPRFLDFAKTKLSEKQAAKLLGDKDGWLYKDGLMGLKGIWSIWAAITELKLLIKKQIDLQQNGLPIQARIGEEDSHEGYVFGSGKNKLKLIDRLGFSKANFAKNIFKDDTLAKNSAMPQASFCFGRLNPPTIGHKQLMQTTADTGGDNTFIFLSNTHNGKKDPLDPNTKARFIKEIYPEFTSYIVDSPVMNPIMAANYLYKQGFRNLVFIAGADRLGDNPGSIEKVLTSWNSAPIRNKDTTFGPNGREQVALSFKSSGTRDPDADVTSVSGISASLARKFATANDKASFEQATGVSSDVVVDGKTLFQATRAGLGLPISESFKTFFISRH